MEKILVIQAARFGDIMQTSRLILSLMTRYETHLAVDERLAEITRLMFPGAIVHAIGFHFLPELEKLDNTCAQLAEIAKIPFRKVFNCNFSRLAVTLSRLFPPDIVTGLRTDGHSDGGILKSPWARLVFRITGSRLASPLNLVDFWGWFFGNPLPSAKINPDAAPGGNGIGLVMSGREKRRSLNMAVIRQILSIADNILKPRSIRLFGLETDIQAANRLVNTLSPALQAKTANLCGKTSLPQLKTELAGLDLLLTPDTGTMHLATRLGVPVMAFFLSSAFCHETGPYGKGHLIWQALPDCGPCLESAPCARNLQCHGIFQDSRFARALSLALQKKPVPANAMPDGLQLWQTDQDALGQKLRLLAGEDKAQEEREITRNILANRLKLPFSLSSLALQKAGKIMEELLPLSEWALPPERYD